MDEEKEEIEEGGFNLDSDEELDLPPEGMEDDFGLEDPEDKYH
jgi:hypothetical protein